MAGPSVWERVGRVGDLGVSVGVGVLMRWVVGTARARHDAGCAVYPSLDMGEGTFLSSDAASTPPSALVCTSAFAFETMVQNANLGSY